MQASNEAVALADFGTQKNVKNSVLLHSGTALEVLPWLPGLGDPLPATT